MTLQLCWNTVHWINVCNLRGEHKNFCVAYQGIFFVSSGNATGPYCGLGCYQPLTETCVHCGASQCGICYRQIGTGTSFLKMWYHKPLSLWWQTSLSPRPVFNVGSVGVGSVIDKLVLGQVFSKCDITNLYLSDGRPASHRGLCSVWGQSVWDLLSTDWYWDKFSQNVIWQTSATLMVDQPVTEACVQCGASQCGICYRQIGTGISFLKTWYDKPLALWW